jgi:hypothetical protein
MAFNLEFGQNLSGKSAQVKSGVPGGSTQDGGSRARTDLSVVKRKKDLQGVRTQTFMIRAIIAV